MKQWNSGLASFLKRRRSDFIQKRPRTCSYYQATPYIAGAVTRILHCWYCDDSPLLVRRVQVKRQREDSAKLPSRNPRRKRCCTVALDLLLTVPGEASTHVTKTIVCCLCLLVNRPPQWKIQLVYESRGRHTTRTSPES